MPRKKNLEFLAEYRSEHWMMLDFYNDALTTTILKKCTRGAFGNEMNKFRLIRAIPRAAFDKGR
jgi:hypothetical protein